MNQSKKIRLQNSILFWIFGIMSLLLVILIPGEIITRIIQKREAPYYNKAQLDDHLGWRTKAHYKSSHVTKTLVGSSYPVNYNTGDHGFRPYGNPQSQRKKIFILGDSYTQAVEANNDKSYADILARNLDAELFCYGQAGYGNLQQYLLLEEYIERIEPDLLILQLCGNDLYDNYADLEIHSSYTVGQKRPYIDLDGNISRYYPIPKWQSIIDKSKFLKLLRKKIQSTFPSLRKDYGPDIWEKRTAFPPYKMSVDITELIIQKIQKLSAKAGVPIVVFVAGMMEPYRGDLIKICNKNKIPCLYKMVTELKKKERAGEDVTTSDRYHWTELGHRFLGNQLSDTLAYYLQKEDIKK